MGAAEAVKEPKAQAYKMPKVFLGDVVLWYADAAPHVKPCPAIVTSVGHDNIMLNVIDPSMHNMILRDGVRHITDPRLKRQEAIDSGCWDYSPRLKDLMEIAAALQPVK